MSRFHKLTPIVDFPLIIFLDPKEENILYFIREKKIPLCLPLNFYILIGEEKNIKSLSGFT